MEQDAKKEISLDLLSHLSFKPSVVDETVFQWSVSLSSRTETGARLTSSVFSCGGCKWQLDMFPSWRDTDNKSIGVNLFCMDAAAENLYHGWSVPAVFCIGVAKPSNVNVMRYKTASCTNNSHNYWNVFSSKTKAVGFKPLVFMDQMMSDDPKESIIENKSFVLPHEMAKMADDLEAGEIIQPMKDYTPDVRQLINTPSNVRRESLAPPRQASTTLEVSELSHAEQLVEYRKQLEKQKTNNVHPQKNNLADDKKRPHTKKSEISNDESTDLKQSFKYDPPSKRLKMIEQGTSELKKQALNLNHKEFQLSLKSNESFKEHLMHLEKETQIRLKKQEIELKQKEFDIRLALLQQEIESKIMKSIGVEKTKMISLLLTAQVDPAEIVSFVKNLFPSAE